MRYRHENKYFIDDKHIFLLTERLKEILEADENSSAPEYTVTSLYFDDAKNTSLFSKLSGDNERLKWRVRMYDDEPSSLFLELKEKRGSLVRKQRSPLSGEAYRLALQASGEIELEGGGGLEQIFFAQIKASLLRPAVIVRYKRRAFVERATNTRITFDTDLRSGYAALDVTDKTVDYLPVLPKGLGIIEIKYDDILPAYIQSLLQCCPTTVQAISKYVLCRKYFKTNNWEDQ